MLNEVIVQFASGRRYSFVLSWWGLGFLSPCWGSCLHGLHPPSWNGQSKWQRQFFLFSKGNWPLIGRDERKEEKKRLNPKEVGEEASGRWGGGGKKSQKTPHKEVNEWIGRIPQAFISPPEGCVPAARIGLWIKFSIPVPCQGSYQMRSPLGSRAVRRAGIWGEVEGILSG